MLIGFNNHKTLSLSVYLLLENSTACLCCWSFLLLLLMLFWWECEMRYMIKEMRKIEKKRRGRVCCGNERKEGGVFNEVSLSMPHHQMGKFSEPQVLVAFEIFVCCWIPHIFPKDSALLSPPFVPCQHLYFDFYSYLYFIFLIWFGLRPKL